MHTLVRITAILIEATKGLILTRGDTQIRSVAGKVLYGAGRVIQIKLVRIDIRIHLAVLRITK
jgi:hypothetical protein